MADRWSDPEYHARSDFRLGAVYHEACPCSVREVSPQQDRGKSKRYDYVYSDSQLKPTTHIAVGSRPSHESGEVRSREDSRRLPLSPSTAESPRLPAACGCTLTAPLRIL